MFDPKQLLDQVLGGAAGAQGRSGVPGFGQGLARVALARDAAFPMVSATA